MAGSQITMFSNSTAAALVNQELGDNFDGLLDRCKQYQHVLMKNKREISKKINLQVVDKSSTIHQTLVRVLKERLLVISLRNEIDQLKAKHAKFKKETENFRDKFQKVIKELKLKYNRMMYFTCLQCVARTSNKIRTDLLGKLDNEAVTSYTSLCRLSSFINETPCKHLLSYINQVIQFWQCILERHYSQDIENILKKINWPFTKNSEELKKLNNYCQHFQRSASMLLKIRFQKNMCTVYNELSTTSQLMEHFSHICVPIALLVVPFRKRFFFHFTGKKPTNKPDKPEWYISRILSWVRDHREFVIEWLGPVFKENGRNPSDCQHEFIVGLLQSVVIKLDNDLCHFQLKDVVFSHIVDETLSFEYELKKMYRYPDDYPSITEVLTQAHIFFKWINMERKYASIKIDTILNGNNPWKVIVEDSQYFMTSSSDGFLTLLNTMSQRYSILPQTRHKLQFLKLQTDLLEEFKEKLVNSSNENQFNEFLVEMLCTLHHVAYILYNWGTNMLFLSLLNHKCDLENKVRTRNDNDPEFFQTEESVFDESIASYNSGIDKLSNSLCESILSKVKHNAKEYKRDKWHIMNSIQNENKYSITDSGWMMYESVSENLTALSEKLPVSLFNKCWPALVYKLSMFIFNDVLLANIFNKGGAQHLKCDVQYKLIPIISKYTLKPSIYIERLLEGCKVLCFEPNFKPALLTQNEVSEILLCRIENQNSIEFN